MLTGHTEKSAPVGVRRPSRQTAWAALFFQPINQAVQIPTGFLQVRNGITLVETSPEVLQYICTVMIQTAPVSDHCIYCVDALDPPLGIVSGPRNFIHVLTFIVILVDDLGNFMVDRNGAGL